MRTCRAWYHARHFFIENYAWKGAILYTSEKVFTIGFEKHSKKCKKHNSDVRKKDFPMCLYTMAYFSFYKFISVRLVSVLKMIYNKTNIHSIKFK